MKIHPNTAGSMISLLVIALLAGAHGQTANGDDADAYWDTSIGIPGSDGPIRAIVVTPSTVVVGGSFGRIGGVETGCVAQWDGESWHRLGSGIPGGGDLGPHVLALAAQGGCIYAAGVFSLAGGVPAGNIAKWDGEKWSALGTGIPYVVKALAVSGTDLYAGGGFDSAGGVAAANIARWDGANWHAVGSGLPGDTVSSLAASDGILYAGGDFTNRTDGVEIKYLAKWDGQQWSQVGSGLNANPCSLLITKSGLVVGDISSADGISLNSIGLWDGKSWSAFGDGLGPAAIGVYALTKVHDVLYAGGFFGIAKGWLANGLAAWDGVSWGPLGSGLKLTSSLSPPDTLAMGSNGAELFVGGIFTFAGGLPATNIAIWHIPRTLKAFWSGNQVALSWPAPDTNFVLEATEDLSASNWVAVPQTASLVGHRWTVTNELSGLRHFYRLRQK